MILRRSSELSSGHVFFLINLGAAVLRGHMREECMKQNQLNQRDREGRELVGKDMTRDEKAGSRTEEN